MLKAHGFPIPEHLVEFLDEFDVNSAREFVEMTNRIDFDEFIRCTCGSLLTSIKNHFDSIFEKKTKQRFFVYSGHDTTLVPLALALGVKKKQNFSFSNFQSFLFFSFCRRYSTCVGLVTDLIY